MPTLTWNAATTGSTSNALRALELTLNAHAGDAHSQGSYFDPRLNGLALQLVVELVLPAGAVGQGEEVRHHWALATLGEARRIAGAARGIAQGYRGMAAAAGAEHPDRTRLATRIVLSLPEAVEPAFTVRQLPAGERRTRRALLGRRA
ncbi:hypothetical protein ACFV84_35135 [Kitasatospora sp. NPDC059811]|uniref:hypothetical protein n=1 Tax=Streptomycetaceae TaxID=2062 RepID=UPI0007AEEF77|nr:hypothetical protein [Streptomyces sp. MJM8645]